MKRPRPGGRATKQISEDQRARVDLTPFCDHTGRVAALAQPWTQGGFTYATDMFIVIKVLAREGEVETDLPFTASIETLLAAHPAPEASKFTALPSLEGTPARVVCRECHETGAVLNDQGKPDFCPCCAGKKQIPNSKSVAVGNRLVAANYLLLLAALPGIRIASKAGRATHPLRFVFDGGEGLVSPKNPTTAQADPE